MEDFCYTKLFLSYWMWDSSGSALPDFPVIHRKAHIKAKLCTAFSSYLFLLNVRILAQWVTWAFLANAMRPCRGWATRNYFPPTYFYWMWESWHSEPPELSWRKQGDHVGVRLPELFSTYLFLMNVRALAQWTAWALLAVARRPRVGEAIRTIFHLPISTECENPGAVSRLSSPGGNKENT